MIRVNKGPIAKRLTTSNEITGIPRQRLEVSATVPIPSYDSSINCNLNNSSLNDVTKLETHHRS